MTKHTKGSRNKTLYIEMTPAEHGVLKVEAAITAMTMGDIIRERLIEPLKAKHGALIGTTEKVGR